MTIYVAKSGEILTYTGRYVNPLALRVEDVDIIDIAHALSMQCRYSGHVRDFWSVAQHSVFCVYYLRARGASLEVQMQALLHDASEAYLHDMARPLKEDEVFGTAFRDAEHEIELVLAEAFDIQFPFDPKVKEADLALLALERQELMPANGHWGVLDGVVVPQDLASAFVPWLPWEAEVEFLIHYDRLFQPSTNHKEA